jgi:thioesterase domain-containing protein
LLPPELDEAELRRRWRIFDAHGEAFEVYRPDPAAGFGGGALLVEASDKLPGRPDLAAQWHGVMEGRLRVEKAPGDHWSLLRGDGADRVAALLRRHLRDPASVPPVRDDRR